MVWIYVAWTLLSWSCVVSETCSTRVSYIHIVCIFKNLSLDHVSPFQHCRVRATYVWILEHIWGWCILSNFGWYALYRILLGLLDKIGLSFKLKLKHSFIKPETHYPLGFKPKHSLSNDSSFFCRISRFTFSVLFFMSCFLVLTETCNESSRRRQLRWMTNRQWSINSDEI